MNAMVQHEQNNPFGSQLPARAAQNAVAEAGQQREIAEVQASMVIAKRFPRNPIEAMDKILQACTRPTLADGALYSYSRGGTDVTGPSIRLAEVAAQAWGNVSFGVRELEQRGGESTVEAFAWDMETNTRQVKVFQVAHERHTKRGVTKLSDPRDIYELIANQGARRLRSCILGVIPGDVIEAAVKQCEETLHANADVSADGIKKLAEAFAKLGVSKEQIEARIQRRLETIRPAQVVQLRKIYASMNDGMSVAADWFDPSTTAAASATDAITKGAKGKAEGKQLSEAEAIRKALQDAKDQDALDLAGDRIRDLLEAERSELTALWQQRSDELSA
jgi:hypothetical protein